MLDSFLIAAIQGCGVVIFASLFFMYFILSDKFLSNRVIRYFIAAAGCAVLLAASDCLQSYYATLDYPTAARMLFAACGYSFRVLILYFVLLLLFREDSQKLKNIFTVLAVVNTLVAFSAFLTEKTFCFTPQNELVRGPLIITPFVVSLIYFVMMLWRGFRDFKKGDRREFVIVLILFAAALIATLTEVIVETRGLLSSVVILGVIFYYMNFLSFSYSYDRLTGAFIRNKLYDDAAAGPKVCGVIALDMNDLKKVNDNCGHDAGDRALAAVGQAVRSCLPANARFYRLGGDEFAVILRSDSAEETAALAEIIRSRVAETSFGVALGWDMRQENEVLEKALSRADVKMYEDKSRIKAK